MLRESFIRQEARQLGFAAVGFAPVGPSQTFNRFQEWLARGFAGDMSYLSRNAVLRSHPGQIAPYAKSLIVVAARYPGSPLVEPMTYWANYAVWKDYHDVLRGKLKQLNQSIRQQMDLPLTSRVCVDTAPLLEREWACRAGVGWIGRQGSLVHPELGCCVFLGELLVNLELEPSPSIPNQCGDCRRCVEACPAGAIQPDGGVDARRCIAYLTIEHKGEIPDVLRPWIGSSLFGCDRCTAVCPWNRVSPAGIMTEFAESVPQMPSPETCLKMTEDDFDRWFHGAAVHRIGLKQLQRNAAIVLENRRHSSPFMK